MFCWIQVTSLPSTSDEFVCLQLPPPSLFIIFFFQVGNISLQILETPGTIWLLYTQNMGIVRIHNMEKEGESWSRYRHTYKNHSHVSVRIQNSGFSLVTQVLTDFSGELWRTDWNAGKTVHKFWSQLYQHFQVSSERELEYCILQIWLKNAWLKHWKLRFSLAWINLMSHR